MKYAEINDFYRNIIIYKLLLVIICITCISGCSFSFDKDVYGLIAKPLFLRNLPKGNDSYSVGFRNGCATSIGVDGKSVLRLHEAKTYNLSNNSQSQYSEFYKLGHIRGREYCGTYANPSTQL